MSSRYLVPVCALMLLPAASAQFSQEINGDYQRVKGFILNAAEKMPEEHYGFQPTPEIRNFGQLVGHVADAQMRTCSSINGESKQAGAGALTSKADLVSALKASFDECDKAYGSLTDANATQMVQSFRGERTKLSVLAGNVSHDNEMYGVMGVYLRLKGIVPPSTEGRGGMGGKKGGKKK